MFLIGTRGGVLVLDVHRVDFAANLGVAFVDDWVFLADGVVGNEKVWYWLSIDIVELVGNLAM